MSKFPMRTLVSSTALLLGLIAALPAEAHRASVFEASPRQSFDFSQGWLMKVGDDAQASGTAFADKGWEPVTLPRAFNETEAFARDIHQLSSGITWYRKHFKLPKGAVADHVVVEFEGVRQAAEVWVNGVEIGLNENGV